MLIVLIIDKQARNDPGKQRSWNAKKIDILLDGKTGKHPEPTTDAREIAKRHIELRERDLHVITPPRRKRA